MKLCEGCDDRGNCVELCEEAETYVGQDHVGMTEIPASQLELDVNDVIDLPWADVKELDETDWNKLMEIAGDILTKKQKKFLYQHIWIGISCRKLGKIYGVSGQAVSAIIRRAKLKIWGRMI